MNCYSIIKMHDLGMFLLIFIQTILVHHRMPRCAITLTFRCLWNFVYIWSYKNYSFTQSFKNCIAIEAYLSHEEGRRYFTLQFVSLIVMSKYLYQWCGTSLVPLLQTQCTWDAAVLVGCVRTQEHVHFQEKWVLQGDHKKTVMREEGSTGFQFSSSSVIASR